jgi:flagellin
MGLRINTNVASLTTQSALKKVTRRKENSLSKLSSGSRINKAGDDAAGLAISEKLKANIRGSQQAGRNANDGISLVQTAEGGLAEVSNILIRLRELSVQAASDTVGNKEREFADLEYQNLTQEIDRIAQSTDFNGTNLLAGEGEKLDFQVGIRNDDFVDRISFEPSKSSAKTEDIGMSGTNVADKVSAQENLSQIDTAINHINGNRASLGALQNRLQITVTNLDTKAQNLSAANSRIRDVDVAEETAKLASSNILTSSATSVLSQANNSQSAALKLIG